MPDNALFLGFYLRSAAPDGGAPEEGGRWQVWGERDGSFLIQQILPNGLADPRISKISLDEFFTQFSAYTGVSPSKPVGVQEGAARLPAAPAARLPEAGIPLEDPDLLASLAPQEEGMGAPVVGGSPEEREENLRVQFSMAMIRLQSDRKTALSDLERLLEDSGPFTPQQKFMFTEFGLALRRRRLFALACRSHERACALAPDDEHVLFNLARAFYDAGKADKARECLLRAVEIAPNFEAGQNFLAFLDARSG